MKAVFNRQIWVWAAKLTKLMIVLSHWLVDFHEIFHFTYFHTLRGSGKLLAVHVYNSTERPNRLDVHLGVSVWWHGGM